MNINVVIHTHTQGQRRGSKRTNEQLTFGSFANLSSYGRPEHSGNECIKTAMVYVHVHVCEFLNQNLDLVNNTLGPEVIIL